MTLAIGRLRDGISSEELGTVFAVTDRLALTAFHCIGNRQTGEVTAGRLHCVWGRRRNAAIVQDSDPFNDVAVLRLTKPLSYDMEPVQLVANVTEHSQFIAPGAPAAVRGVSGFSISGQVAWTASQLDDGAPVIQLACRESAAGLSLYGMSGAPVLVGEPARAVALIRWNPPRSDRPDLAAGAAVFATPAAAILGRWPELGITRDRLQATFQRLSSRTRAQGAHQVLIDVRQLLLTGNLGLYESNLEDGLTGQIGRQDIISIEAGCTIIAASGNLQRREAIQSGERTLNKYLAERDRNTNQRYVGILTDGVEWHVYRRIDSKLHHVEGTFVADPALDVDDLISWLEAVLATSHPIRPTPNEIVRKLGADSPSYALDLAELTAIYARCRHMPTVRIKRDIWASLLTTASGTTFTNDDWLFVNHTLLVTMAEIIGHAVVGFQPEQAPITATTITSGALFSQALIGGVVEADFFDWLTHVPEGERFIKDIARRLTRFAWNQVEHDVMKVLYESIIPADIRHRLGEYYTPDWLAEEILSDCASDPLAQRVLDASCGSGTFLFHAIRNYLAAAEDAQVPLPDIIANLTKHVIGFDVHPVAVTLARVTYLLAIGVNRLQAHNRPAFSVPVYLADSLRWGRETTLWSDDNFTVPTTLNQETFVTDPAFASPSAAAHQLKFPDRVVADASAFDRLITELADLATKRNKATPVPSLRTIFRRFNVHADDRPVLERTFELMCTLHDEDRDHIWGYYVRNLARPVWLKRPENRVDVLVGNPPWLAYRYMTEVQKDAFRMMAVERQLWAGSRHATSQDLSALFVVRCIEQYLRPGGQFGYVMPWGTLSRGPYAGFRTGRYPTQAELVTVAFDRPWDLHGIKPTFFPVPASVVFGRRTTDMRVAPLTMAAEQWSGRFRTKEAARDEATDHIGRIVNEPSSSPNKRTSPYADRFYQGATVVPRFLFLVDPDEQGPLGSGAGRRAVRSHRSALEKRPWKDLSPLRGVIERDFVTPLYLGDSILPFRLLEPVQSIVPWDGHRLLSGADSEIDLYPGLAAWWRAAEAIWMQHRSNDRLDLLGRLNYHRGLSQQYPAGPYRVVYNKSGMYLAAATVTDQTAVIDQQLYWGSTNELDEARFLTAILNSTVLTLAVRPLQARGEHNPRHFDKYIFQLPIPRYDVNNAAHAQLVALAKHAEKAAGAVALPTARFETQRRVIREALAEDGVIANIDAIVKAMLL